MPPRKRQYKAAKIKRVASEEYKKKLRSFQKSKPQPMRPKLSKKERKQYTIKAPYPQSYFYPPAIISYIARNPSNHFDHGNLIQSAKSLLRLSRIIPVEEVQSCQDDENKWMADNRKFSLTEKSFDIWITSNLLIRTLSNPYFASTLLKRIYRCSPQTLKLHNQILTLKEVKFLISEDYLFKVEFIENTVMNHVDQSVVKFENVIEILLLKSRFVKMKIPFEEHGIGKDTARKMVEWLENEKNWHVINLKNIPENFQFATFSCFLKTNLTGNQQMKHDIKLSFATTISPTLKNQLQTFVHEILALVENDPSLIGFHVPKIKFPGHNEEAYSKLKQMRYKNQRPMMSARRAMPEWVSGGGKL